MQNTNLRALSSRELVRRLIDDISGLVNKQLELVRVEGRENLRETLMGAKLLVAGVFCVATAWIALVVTVILALALVIPGWLAALLVAIFFLIVGGALAWAGKSDIVTKPLARSRESLREDMEWARRHGSSSAT